MADRWSSIKEGYVKSTWTAAIITKVFEELNAIIATEPDPVENRQSTASGPVMHESVWCDGRNVTLEEMLEKAKDVDQWREIKPVIEPAVAEKVYEIATRAVRDAFRKHAAAVAAVSDAIGKDCEAERKERET